MSPVARQPETAAVTRGTALEKLRLRIAKAESMLDQVAALSPTLYSPVELSATPRDSMSSPAKVLEFEELPVMPAAKAEPRLDEVAALSPAIHNSAELTTTPRDVISSSAAPFEFEEPPLPAAALTLELREAVPPIPAISPELDAAELHSPPRSRADFIRKTTPGGWADKGLAADAGAVMFNHERVGVHASDRAVLPVSRPIVGSQWRCVSKAGVSARAQFAAAMASRRQLSDLERAGIELSIRHIYYPGDCITVRDVLVNDDPISVAERRACMHTAPSAGAAGDEAGAENADNERLSYQVLTDRGWVNLVSRSGKVLFVADRAEEHTAAAVMDRRHNSRRGCLCVSSSRPGSA